MKLQVAKARKMLVSKLNILKNPFSPTERKPQLLLHTDATKGALMELSMSEYEVMRKTHVYLVIKHVCLVLGKHVLGVI